MTTKSSRQTNTPAAELNESGAAPGALPSTASLEAAWEAEICVRQLRALFAASAQAALEASSDLAADFANLPKQQQPKLQEHEEKARLLQECRPPVTVRPLGAMPFVAGTWDFLELTACINALLGPKQDAAWSHGAVCRALALHLAETDMGCLGHAKTVQLGAWLLADLQGVGAEIALPDTQAVTDLLDAIAAFGDTSFFNTLAASIWQRLDRPPTTVCLATPSVHLVEHKANRDGETSLVVGRRRAFDEPTDEFRLIGLCDRDTWLPVFVHDIEILPHGSRKANAAALLTSLLEQDAGRLQEIFPSIRQISLDQPQCTPKTVRCCRKAGLHALGRLPAAQVRTYLAEHPGANGGFVHMRNVRTSLGKVVHGLGGKWCQDVRVDNQPVCAVLVVDRLLEGKLRDRCLAAAHRRVDEMAQVLDRTFPTRDEALAELRSRRNRNDLCSLDNAVIKEVRGATSGTGFRIEGAIAINKPVLDAALEQTGPEACSLVVSTDQERTWTMDELWMLTGRPEADSGAWSAFAQSIVWMDERCVNTQARYRALLCLLNLFALVFGGTALLAGSAMERLGLSVEDLERGTPASGQPVGTRAGSRVDACLPTRQTEQARPGHIPVQPLLKAVRKSHMAVFRQGGQVIHVRANPHIRDVLAAMGEPWLRHLAPAAALDTNRISQL